jgi:hypothetical protein
VSIYSEAERQGGYSPWLFEIADDATNMRYSASKATGSLDRDSLYWEAAAEAKRMYQQQRYGVAFMPLGLWLVMTAAGAFVSWFIQRRLDEWFPKPAGAVGDSE